MTFHCDYSDIWNHQLGEIIRFENVWQRVSFALFNKLHSLCHFSCHVHGEQLRPVLCLSVLWRGVWLVRVSSSSGCLLSEQFDATSQARHLGLGEQVAGNVLTTLPVKEDIHHYYP